MESNKTALKKADFARLCVAFLAESEVEQW